jgi:hypothetical protein
MVDSGGPGRYRGGAGMEIAITPHGSPDGGLHYVVSGKGAVFPMSDGLAGGYPGAPNAYLWVKNNEAPHNERSAGRYASTLAQMPGERQPVDWGVFPLMGEDALYVRWDGGGGVGDPLEREPAAVLADVRDGLTSPASAAQVYGVVVDSTGGAVDAVATESQRNRLRARRSDGNHAGGGQPAVVKLARQRQGENWVVGCADCGAVLSAGTRPWKDRARARERPLGAVMPIYATRADLVLREFCCPGCGGLLDTEMALAGEPPLRDRLGVEPQYGPGAVSRRTEA